MNPLIELRRPGWFLVTFAAATAVLLAVWQLVSGYYLVALVWVTNQALAALGEPMALRAPATGDGVIYPVVAGAVALFVVTPGRSAVWKLRWLTTLMLGLFLLHACLLYGDSRGVLAATSGAGAVPSPMPRSGLSHLLRGNLTLAVVALTWVVALRRRRPASGPARGRGGPNSAP